MIKYGLISEIDARTIEKTIDLICEQFNEPIINVTEVGVYGGDTGFGITDYICRTDKEGCFLTGVENNRDGEKNRTIYDKMLIGNSSEVYNQIKDDSQHLVFIDANHTFPAVIADFFCYSTKVKPGGYIAFHDTGRHINPLHGWQGVGDKNDSDMCLGGVRKALTALSLLDYSFDFRDGILYPNSYPGWELIFDDADPLDEAGGVTVFKRLY